MAELQKMSGLKAMLDKVTAYREVLEKEQAAQQAADAEQAQASAEMTALVEAACIVAASDGKISGGELERLVARVGELTEGRFSGDALQGIAEIAADRVASEGVPARADAVAASLRDPDLRRAALLVAGAVAWLDGGVGTKEGLALQALARSFGIPIDEMHRILGQAHG